MRNQLIVNGLGENLSKGRPAEWLPLVVICICMLVRNVKVVSFHSLQLISLLSNKIVTVSLDTLHFKLKRADSISLARNQIRKGPRAFFNTLNTSLHLSINMDVLEFKEGFCDDYQACTCCDFYEFGLWLKENNNSLREFKAQCGKIKYTAENVHTLPLDDACVEQSTSQPTLPTTTTSTSGRTSAAGQPQSS